MHEQFLHLALDLAKKGQGRCAPNPCVGAVAVQNGVIIAQAFHKGAGTPHAEQLLLTQFPPNTPGVTVYSTLEPCNHWGRTPPCVEALIQHGVEAVVFSYYDPNPQVAKNNSTVLLQAQGIAVTQINIPEIEAFYASYAYWLSHQKPKITAKMAHTFDGKIAGPNGARIQLSNALCGAFTQRQRADTDLILTTAKTIRLDNPKMNARLQDETLSKPVAIIDRGLSLSGHEDLFTTASHCHVFHSKEQDVSYPNSSFYRIAEKNGRIDLFAVISQLGRLGFHDVWVEAGGELFQALHLEGLVNRTYLYLVPKSLGPEAISAYGHQDLFTRPHTVSWQAMGDNMLVCLDWQED